MTSDKFTKDFSDFGSYTRPGMLYPDMFNRLPAGKGGDSQPGLQYMSQLALSAYGEYHVIDGCVPEIDGTDVTGHIGYVMIIGNITEVQETGEFTLSSNDYLCIDSTGGYYTTGAKPTGVIIAENFGGTLYHTTRRESNNINYFPTGVVFYGDLYSVKTNASGFDKLSTVTGQFEYLDGYSDIIALDNIDMNGYDIKGASDITGSTITGGSLLISNNISVGGTVDGVDVSLIKLNSMPSAADGDISCNSQNIISVANVDGVNISTFKSSYDTHASNVIAHIDNLTDIPTRSHTSLSDKGTYTHPQIDSHIGAVLNGLKPADIKADNYLEECAYINNTGQNAYASWRLSGDIDTSKDVFILMTYKCEWVGVPRVGHYISARATNNTEGESWNIENGVDRDYSYNTNIKTLSITIGNADIADDDILRLYLNNWDYGSAGRYVKIYDISLKYSKK